MSYKNFGEIQLYEEKKCNKMCVMGFALNTSMA